jgi:hypothetical protein
MKKLSLVLALLLMGCSITTVSAQQTIQKVGDEFYMGVKINNGVDITGMSVWIKYDPAIVEIVDTNPSTPGTQVDAQDLGYLTNGVLLASIQDSAGVENHGTLVIGYSSIPVTPTSGSGDCFKFKLKGKAVGSTGIAFLETNKVLQAVSGAVDADWYSGAVQIEEAPPPPIRTTVEVIFVE